MIRRHRSALFRWYFLYTEAEYSTSADVPWIFIVKGNKYPLLPFDNAEDVSRVMMAAYRLDYWFDK